MIDIGTLIESRPRVSRWAWFWLAVAVGLLIAWPVTQELNWAMGAIFPLVMASILWMTREKEQAFIVGQNGLESTSWRQSVQWSELQDVKIAGRYRDDEIPQVESAAIRINTVSGVRDLPARLNLPSGAVFQYLRDKIPVNIMTTPIPGALLSYYEKQREKFPAETIHVIGPRQNQGKIPVSNGMRFGLALFLTGIVTAVAAVVGEKHFSARDTAEIWHVWAFVFGILGGFIALLAAAIGRERKKAQQLATSSCLVVTPAALAVSQGTDQGVLKWGEISSLKRMGSAGSFHVSSRGHKLRILIQGGLFELQDVYERPLGEIASLIRQHLGEPEASESFPSRQA